MLRTEAVSLNLNQSHKVPSGKRICSPHPCPVINIFNISPVTWKNASLLSVNFPDSLQSLTVRVFSFVSSAVFFPVNICSQLCFPSGVLARLRFVAGGSLCFLSVANAATPLASHSAPLGKR